MCHYTLNPYLNPHPRWSEDTINSFSRDDIQPFHRSIPGYEPTPLVTLTGLAGHLGVSGIQVKDESHRFGLKAFKALGASYAMYRFIENRCGSLRSEKLRSTDMFLPGALRHLSLPTFCTATDGNHGRAVAWFSRLVEGSCVVYMPAGTVPARVKNIENENARVVVIEGDYDHTVRRIDADAKTHGWQVISDTSYPGYTEIPNWIMAGYLTMFAEIDQARHERGERQFTHIFLQSGVGSFAAAAAWHYSRAEKPPVLISVEPASADCLLESARHDAGEPKTTRGNQRTIMAGLNCGTPSLVAWPLIRDRFKLFIGIGDEFSRKAMRRYYHPLAGDQRIVSGESGAAGLGGLMALLESDALSAARSAVGIGEDSRILLINTEGDTDPVNFKAVVNSN